jgi:hypothetical protein
MKARSAGGAARTGDDATWSLCWPRTAHCRARPKGHCYSTGVYGRKQEERRVAPALGGKGNSWLGDAINPFAVLASYRVYRQPHFLAQRAADEAAYRMSLPTGRFHNLGKRCAALPL